MQLLSDLQRGGTQFRFTPFYSSMGVVNLERIQPVYNYRFLRKLWRIATPNTVPKGKGWREKYLEGPRYGKAEGSEPKGATFYSLLWGLPPLFYSTWQCVLLLEIFILRDLYFKSIMLTLTLLDKHFVSFRSQDIGVRSIDSYSNFQRCAISIVVPLPNRYSKDIKQAMYCALKKYTHAPPPPPSFSDVTYYCIFITWNVLKENLIK